MAFIAKAPHSKKEMTALTWNIEGIRRNIFTLANVLHTKSPSLVFLNEVQLYQCDLNTVVQYIHHDYCYHLNSEDLYNFELPLLKSRAKRGTMILW